MHWNACGILVPWPRIEPGPWHWEHGVLATGPPGNSHTCILVSASDMSSPPDLRCSPTWKVLSAKSHRAPKHTSSLKPSPDSKRRWNPLPSLSWPLFSLPHSFSSVQSLSCVQFFATPWTSACQASLSFTNFWSLLKLMSTESVKELVTPSKHLIHCHPLHLLTSVFPSIRVSSSESVLRIRWPKWWSFSFSISPSNEQWTDFL